MATSRFAGFFFAHFAAVRLLFVRRVIEVKFTVPGPVHKNRGATGNARHAAATKRHLAAALCMRLEIDGTARESDA
jgi:hypothetical protein